MDKNQTRQFTTDLIEAVWNQQQFDKLDAYLHPDYIDHSLPAVLTPDRTGLQKWIEATSQSFQHQTIIDDQVTEANKTMLKIKMVMTHIGEWRGIDSTGAQVSTVGYRFYRLAEGKIIEHWAAIDGNLLETQLKQHAPAGYKVSE